MYSAFATTRREQDQLLRVVGGIHIENDLFRCYPVIGHKFIDEISLNGTLGVDDSLVPTQRVGICGGKFHPIQRALSGKRLIAADLFSARHINPATDELKQLVIAHLLPIVYILVAQRDYRSLAD